MEKFSNILSPEQLEVIRLSDKHLRDGYYFTQDDFLKSRKKCLAKRKHSPFHQNKI